MSALGYTMIKKILIITAYASYPKELTVGYSVYAVSGMGRIEMEITCAICGFYKKACGEKKKKN